MGFCSSTSLLFKSSFLNYLAALSSISICFCWCLCHFIISLVASYPSITGMLRSISISRYFYSQHFLFKLWCLNIFTASRPFIALSHFRLKFIFRINSSGIKLKQLSSTIMIYLSQPQSSKLAGCYTCDCLISTCSGFCFLNLLLLGKYYGVLGLFRSAEARELRGLWKLELMMLTGGIRSCEERWGIELMLLAMVGWYLLLS